MLLARDVPSHPGEHRWLTAHRTGYRAGLAGDPVATALVAAALGNRRWIADFLAPPPTDEPALDFHAELAGIRATPASVALADLRVALGGTPPDLLDRADLAERTADLLDWVWERTVRPSWPERLRILQADVTGRTRQLSRGGWAAALDEMRPGMRWLGDGRLQINAYDSPPRDLSGAELRFVPITPRTGWTTWREPSRYAVVYPCSAPLAAGRRSPVPDSLADLLGAGRARVLVLLGAPHRAADARPSRIRPPPSPHPAAVKGADEHDAPWPSTARTRGRIRANQQAGGHRCPPRTAALSPRAVSTPATRRTAACRCPLRRPPARTAGRRRGVGPPASGFRHRAGERSSP